MVTATTDEFKNNVNYIFTALDMDNNNVLDWDECLKVVTQVMKGKEDYNPLSFKDAYEAMDKNDDGKISKDEMLAQVMATASNHGLINDSAPIQPA
jgi:Ca2+-binding EF-hand superfamily protein